MTGSSAARAPRKVRRKKAAANTGMELLFIIEACKVLENRFPTKVEGDSSFGFQVNVFDIGPESATWSVAPSGLRSNRCSSNFKRAALWSPRRSATRSRENSRNTFKSGFASGGVFDQLAHGAQIAHGDPRGDLVGQRRSARWLQGPVFGNHLLRQLGRLLLARPIGVAVHAPLGRGSPFADWLAGKFRREHRLHFRQRNRARRPKTAPSRPDQGGD